MRVVCALLVLFSPWAFAEFTYDLEMKASTGDVQRVVLPGGTREYPLSVPNSNYQCVLRSAEFDLAGPIGYLEMWCCVDYGGYNQCTGSSVECRKGRDGAGNFMLMESIPTDPSGGMAKTNLSLFCKYDPSAIPTTTVTPEAGTTPATAGGADSEEDGEMDTSTDAAKPGAEGAATPEGGAVAPAEGAAQNQDEASSYDTESSAQPSQPTPDQSEAAPTEGTPTQEAN